MNNKPEKIFDIIPPKSEIRQPDFEEKELPTQERKPFNWRLPLIFIFLIILGVSGYFFLPRVEIEIWPELEEKKMREKVELDGKANQPDFSKKVIPAKILEVSQEMSQDFTPTGKVPKEERAHGQIKVYNAYSEFPQTLMANTRFFSAEGKLFRSTEQVTIPGGHYEKGKLIPGSLDIQVVAAEPGESYNVGPSTFSIPGFAGSPKYTAFYGKSFSPMTGGLKGEVPQVTSDDLEKAKNALTDKLFEEERKAIQGSVLPEFVLLNDTLKQEIKDVSFSAKELDLVQSFNCHLRVVSKALVFRRADLENFSSGSLLLQLPQQEKKEEESFWLERRIQPESLKIDSRLESLDLESEKATLNLGISANVYYGLDESLLRKSLLGKSFAETTAILENQSQIRKAEAKFWPFWVNKVPQQEERIKIKINLGDYSI